MEDLIAAQHEELARLRSLQQHRNTQFASDAVEDYLVGRKMRKEGAFDTTQRVPDLAACNQAAAGVEKAKMDDALNYKRRIKSSNTFLTESSFTSSALSKSVVKTTVPAPSLSSRTNPSLKERESFYASQINDMSWMGNFQRSVEESLAEGEREGKVEEIQRELFNTVEALEGERMETKRVKGELVQKTLEAEELRDQNSQLHANLRALKSGVPAASELEDLKNQVFQLAEEGEKRKKMEEDMREMWKKSEGNASKMEEKWVNEQVAVEAELKKMADWKAHAERGLAELEAEKDDWEAKYDAMLSRNKELVKRTRDAEEMAEEAWNEVEEKAAEAASAVTILEPEDNLIRIQKERAIVKSPRRKSSRSFDTSLAEGNEVVDLENIEVLDDAVEELLDGSSKVNEDEEVGTGGEGEGNEKDEDEDDEEVMEVLAKIDGDDAENDGLPATGQVPPQAPPKTEAVKRLLLDVEQLNETKGVMTSGGADEDGDESDNGDSDSVKSIEWVASSLTPRKIQHPPTLSDNFKKMQDIQRRPKARIEPSGVTRRVIPKSPPKRSKLKRVTGAVPKSPSSPPVPPRPKRATTANKDLPSAPLSPTPPRDPPAKQRGGEEEEVKAPMPYVVSGVPELPSHLVVTEELQNKYKRENTPDRKKKKTTTTKKRASKGRPTSSSGTKGKARK